MDCLIDCFCCLCFRKLEFIEPHVIEWKSMSEEYHPDYIPFYLDMIDNPLYKDMSGKTPKYVNMAP